MASETRIYKVVTTVRDSTGEGASRTQLVEAATASQALKHAVKDHITCEVCSVPDAIDLGAKGIKVVKAGA